MPRTFHFGLDQGGTSGEDRLRHVLYLAFDLAADGVSAIRRCSGRRRQRRALLDLDDRLLADIGISREAAVREAEKWPWR